MFNWYRKSHTRTFIKLETSLASTSLQKFSEGCSAMERTTSPTIGQWTRQKFLKFSEPNLTNPFRKSLLTFALQSFEFPRDTGAPAPNYVKKSDKRLMKCCMT